MEGTKIKVQKPVVEMDGDEMTRIIWKFIRDKVRPLFASLASHSLKLTNYFITAHSAAPGHRHQIL